ALPQPPCEPGVMGAPSDGEFRRRRQELAPVVAVFRVEGRLGPKSMEAAAKPGLRGRIHFEPLAGRQTRLDAPEAQLGQNSLRVEIRGKDEGVGVAGAAR